MNVLYREKINFGKKIANFLAIGIGVFCIWQILMLILFPDWGTGYSGINRVPLNFTNLFFTVIVFSILPLIIFNSGTWFEIYSSNIKIHFLFRTKVFPLHTGMRISYGVQNKPVLGWVEYNSQKTNRVRNLINHPVLIFSNQAITCVVIEDAEKIYSLPTKDPKTVADIIVSAVQKIPQS